MTANRVVRLVERPVGMVTRECFAFEDEAMPEPGAGEFRVRLEYISLDPAMRGWMAEGRSYVEPVGLGETMRAYAAGYVEASNNPRFKEGEAVTGLFGVQHYAVSDGSGVVKADPELAPLEAWVGGLGMPGWTAYFGLLEVGEAKEGDTVVVSAASGAVGSVVGQIAKIQGCRVVGIAGGAETRRHLTDELGLDAVIDYKAGGLADAYKAAMPDGCDVFFDNVGGEQLDLALASLRERGRVAICGRISQTASSELYGIKNIGLLIGKRARMQGFIVFDFNARYPEVRAWIGQHLKAGRIHQRLHVLEGLEQAPEALGMLFRGENTGKLLVQVAAE